MSQSLTCALCELRKPVGILSVYSWGSVEGMSEPAYACPDCQGKHHDWREQLARIANGSN